MKTISYLGIAALLGVITLTACKTTPPERSASGGLEPAPTVTGRSSHLVTLLKSAPRIVTVGDEFEYDLDVTADSDVSETTVVHTLPAGATFVRAEPVGAHEGDKLTWKLGAMNRGETKHIKVTLKADKEGELVNSATVSATFASVCLTNRVAKPQLAIDMTGPKLAQVGQEVVYTVVVQNTGSTTAKDVIIINTVPEGLSSAGAEKELTFNVGDLAPSVSKTIPIPLKAEKRGKVSNQAVAASSRGGKVQSETSTTIVQTGVHVAKTTNDKELFINRAASYDILVSNTGDTDLSGVVLTHTAAAGTFIAGAEGATVAGNTATWKVGELKAADKKNFNVKLLSKTPGRFPATATVTTDQGLTSLAQDYTEWKGVTGVLVEFADDPDPIQVGETSTFIIRVANQGSAIDIKDLNIIATVPDGLELVADKVSDGGVVDGKTIRWPTVASLAPKASVGRSYVAKGVKAGDARSKASITTSMRKDPIEEFESTTVY